MKNRQPVQIARIIILILVWSVRVCEKSFFSLAKLICAATLENVPSEMYAQRRSIYLVTDTASPPRGDYVHSPSLIRIFTGHSFE